MTTLIYQCQKCDYIGKTKTALDTHSRKHVREEQRKNLVHVPNKQFLDNWHTKTYYQIINSARKKQPTGYTEKHHIIPRCLGGSNGWKNIVRLTARQHFICHCLLSKMVKTTSPEYYKLLNAIMAMKAIPGNTDRYVSAFLYEQARIKYSKLKSEEMKTNNPRTGKIWVVNFRLKENRIVDQTEFIEYISSGWKRGRVVNFNRYNENGTRKPYLRKKKAPKPRQVAKSVIEALKKIMDISDPTEDNIQKLRDELQYRISVLNQTPNAIKKEFNLSIGNISDFCKITLGIKIRTCKEHGLLITNPNLPDKEIYIKNTKFNIKDEDRKKILIHNVGTNTKTYHLHGVPMEYGFQNGIMAEVIAHPANCVVSDKQLTLGCVSLFSYEDLMKRIETWDSENPYVPEINPVAFFRKD